MNHQFQRIYRTFSSEDPIADPYETLGVPRNASIDEIKKGFRKMAKAYHPDKDMANEEKFRTIL